MARNLAALLRIMDGARPTCLMHDGDVWLDAADAQRLDDCAVLTDDPPYPGLKNKTRLLPTPPCRRAMLVDADCPLLERDIDVYWAMTQPHPVAVTGDRRAHGEWKGADVARLLRQEGAPSLVQTNSGVFCFDNKLKAESFFAGLNDFDAEPQRGLSCQHTVR